MAVAEFRNVQASLSGSAEGPDRRNVVRGFSVQAMVRVDDAVPDPKTVLDFCERNANLPWIGRDFLVGGGFDRNARCRRLDVAYIPDSAGWFTATGTYSHDPLPEKDEIDVTFTQVSVPVEFAIFRGATVADGVRRNVPNVANGRVRTSPFLRFGLPLPVTNSAGSVHEPAIEAEVDVKVIRVTKIVPAYDDALFSIYQGMVNNDVVTIDRPDLKFKTTFSPFFGRIKVIGGALFVDELRRIRWRQTTEIHVHPHGWRRKILDQGTHTTDFEQAANETPVSTREVDDTGAPLTQPVLLDGNGGKLNLNSREAVYLIWSTYPEGPFMPLKNKVW